MPYTIKTVLTVRAYELWRKSIAEGSASEPPKELGPISQEERSAIVRMSASHLRSEKREKRLAHVLRKLGFSEGLTWPSVARAMRDAGFSIDEVAKLPIDHVFEILEAKANALDYLRRANHEDKYSHSTPFIRKLALMAGGRPVETAGRIDGKKLRELRGDTSRAIFARLCNISVQTLLRAERGNASPGTIRKIKRYLRATGRDIKLEKG